MYGSYFFLYEKQFHSQGFRFTKEHCVPKCYSEIVFFWKKIPLSTVKKI